MDLFDLAKEETLSLQAPLAERMRPRTIAEILGQEQILGKDKFLNRCIKARRLPSIILYGPPGTGKTTIGKAIAKEIEAEFFQLNAVTSGVKEIREVVDKAEQLLGMYRKKSILFIDEIHRFSKNQQDALLPHVERGLLTLIGATTENPYYQVNAALISRTTVLKLELLSEETIVALLERTIADRERGFGNLSVEAHPEALLHIAAIANGDVRRAYNALEVAVLSTPPNNELKIIIDLEVAQESIQKRALQYDKDGDQHYDVISAFIKSIRGSDPDAALHYLAKMLYGGEDPEFIGRRLVISASEDIGNADPQALLVAMAAHQAVQIIGMPEARINLAQATTYLATAPKSNAAYLGVGSALQDIEKTKTTVPLHLRDSSYAKGFGHGKGYMYAHDYENHYVQQQYLPDELNGRRYYEPTELGYEKKISDYMAWLKCRE